MGGEISSLNQANMNIPFKIRASRASELAAGDIGLTDIQQAELNALEARINADKIPLTDKQRAELEAFEVRIKDKEIKKPLTPVQQAKYDDLFDRKDAKLLPLTDNQRDKMIDLQYKARNLELPQTAKTLIIQWLDDILHKQTANFTNKYVQKGHQVEDESLMLIAHFMEIPHFALHKNEQFFENEFAQGTPDALPSSPKIVVDAKSSWSHRTFPLHVRKCKAEYIAQMNIYMWLTGRKQALVAHTLVNTPNDLVEYEARNLAKEMGIKYTDDVFADVKKNHVHDHKPLKLRVKGFYVDYDQSFIDEVKRRVPLAKSYIQRLLEKDQELADIFLLNTGQKLF